MRFSAYSIKQSDGSIDMVLVNKDMSPIPASVDVGAPIGRQVRSIAARDGQHRHAIVPPASVAADSRAIGGSLDDAASRSSGTIFQSGCQCSGADC
jgi:hypothetical protein